MPKSICPDCEKGEIIDVPLDEDGTDTYQMCSNPDCPSSSQPYISDEVFDDEDEVFADIETSLQSPTKKLDPLTVIRVSLLNIRWHISNLISVGDLVNAKSLLESVINMLLPSTRIPPGRRYATESKRLQLKMRAMGLHLYNLKSSDPIKHLTHVTLTVFDWLLQTEDELKQGLIGQLRDLVPAIEAVMSNDKTSPKGAQMIDRVRIIRLALDRVDSEGSPPVIPEG